MTGAVYVLAAGVLWLIYAVMAIAMDGGLQGGAFWATRSSEW